MDGAVAWKVGKHLGRACPGKGLFDPNLPYLYPAPLPQGRVLSCVFRSLRNEDRLEGQSLSSEHSLRLRAGL